MSAPRLRGTPEANDTVRTARIVVAVRTADPDLDEATVRAALDLVAPRPFGRAVIARELAAAPWVLTSGRAESKSGTQKLIKALVAAGSTTIRRPRCTICRRVKDLDLHLASGGQACVACSRMLRSTRCAGCGQLRPPWARLADGSTRCGRCWEYDPSRLEPCSDCGRARPVARRGPSGPLCQACSPRAAQPCSRCLAVAPVHSRLGGESVCSTCAHRSQRICTRCRYPRLHQDPDPGCARCDTTDAVRCPDCGDDRFAFRIGARGCLRCRLHRHVDRLTIGADPDRAALLQPFLDRLRQADDPRASIDWISKRRLAKTTLADMLVGKTLVNHESLDRAALTSRGRSASVEYLRQLLVDSAVLPARDEPLHRVEATITRRLASCPEPTAAVLRRYAAWQVLPLARRRTSTKHSSALGAGSALARFVAAHDFCTWLERHGTNLACLSQPDVDAWAAENPDLSSRVASFTAWAGRNHLIPSVRIVRRERSLPLVFASVDDHVRAARTCLTDDSLPASDRLAGALLLLYGQPVSRIARLRRSDLELDDETLVSVRLGSTPLVLPAPLDLVARQVADQARHTAPGIARGFVDQRPWLFPGRPPSRPISKEGLSRRLTRRLHLPPARALRNTTLVTLAGEVPPVVLADLLGLHPATVERWRDLAGGNVASYTAARLRNATNPTASGGASASS